MKFCRPVTANIGPAVQAARSICYLLFQLFVIAVLAAPMARLALAEEDSRPNILFILADDVGCETLGAYGGTSYETPRLDQLAREGLRFTNGFSMPVCHPTRVCFLTGKYPFRLGHPRWGSFPVDHERHTIANVLKDSGYATAIAGKWQIALLKDDLEHPHRLGFDDYCLFGWHEGPRYYEPLIWQNGRRRTDVQDQYGPDVYCQFLIDFIERVDRQNRTGEKRQPFFAFYSMALCHDVTDDLDKPVPLGPKGRYDSYTEMIENMDREVGKILDALDRLKLAEETLVIFTGDNGTPKSYIATAEGDKLIRLPVYSMQDGQKLRGGKGNLTDLGTNVPLLVRWSGKTSQGEVVEDLVDMSDYFATFAELAGADVTSTAGEPIDGQSFARRLLENRPAPRSWAYAERGSNRFWVQTPRWKLYSTGELFDMKVDPREASPIRSSDKSLSQEARQAIQQLQPVVDKLKSTTNTPAR